MRYFARKLFFYLIAAWVAITLNFLIPHLIKGNPVDVILAKVQGSAPLPPQARHALEVQFGHTDEPLLPRYWQYLQNLFTGDFGLSVTYYPTPVSAVLSSALPWTIMLVGVSTVISFVLGVGFGALAGWKRGTWLDHLVPSTNFLSAIPYFWLALVLVYVLGNVYGLFPLSGGYAFTTDIGLNPQFLLSAAYHAVLPALTIVLSSVAAWLLGMRNMMVSTMSEDYVVTAEAKGLRPRRVMVSYAARNAVLPSVAGFAISLGFIVSGSVVTEAVFSYPGVGYLLLQAVRNSDYPLMQAIFLFITLAVLGANLLVDLLYGVIDPRTRQTA